MVMDIVLENAYKYMLKFECCRDLSLKDLKY